MSATARLLDTQLDPLSSPLLLRELPGAQTAFDAEAMRGYLQRALFGDTRDEYTIERCEPGQSVYTGDCCIVRYELDVKDNQSGRVFQPLVTGRIFQDQATCDQYLRERLAPLAEQTRGHEDLVPFTAPVAMIAPLHMV